MTTTQLDEAAVLPADGGTSREERPPRARHWRRAAALSAVIALALADLAASHYQPLALDNRGGGTSASPHGPLALTADQILMGNGGPFDVTVLAVRPVDTGNVGVVADLLAPCTPSAGAHPVCTFDLGVMPTLAPLHDRVISAHQTLYLEHAMTLNCATLAKGYNPVLRESVDVTYRFGWFTHTVRLTYRGSPGFDSYTFPNTLAYSC